MALSGSSSAPSSTLNSQSRKVSLQLGQFSGHFLEGLVVFFLHRQVQEQFQIFHLALVLGPIRQGLEQGAPFLEDLRGPGLVVPEIGGRHQLFQMPQSYLFTRQIKDDLEGLPAGP